MEMCKVLCLFSLLVISLSSGQRWSIPRNRSEGLIFCCEDDVTPVIKQPLLKPIQAIKKDDIPTKIDEVVPLKAFDPKDFDVKDFDGFHKDVPIKRRRPSERGCVKNTQPKFGCFWAQENGTTVESCRFGVTFGSDADVGEFPYVVAIGFPSGGDISWACGGTLISKTFVVTAAHCAFSRQTGTAPSMIRLGAHNITAQGDPLVVDSAIARIVEHPEYTLSMKYHDIALMELATPVGFTDRVKAACLWHSPVLDFQGRLTTIGWGTTGYGKDRSEILQKGLLDVIPKETCQSMVQPTKQYPQVTDDQVCALDLSGKPGMLVDSCQGDSGGPLVTKDSRGPGYEVPYIVGVTSFGKSCSKGSPGIYTKISSYVPWIESIVWPDTTGN